MRGIRWLVAIALFIAAPARAQDAFSDHYQRGEALAANEQYVEAARELEAAFAIRQPPRLLYELAQVYRKLGNAPRALDYYRRFLIAEPQIGPEARQEMQQEMVRLQQLAPPPAPPPQPAGTLQLPPDIRLAPVRIELRSHRGLIAGGSSLLATSYAAALIAGSMFAALASPYDSSTNGNLQAAGGTLLIPVLGPFIGALVFRTPYWSLPWVLVDGAAQVAGLAMIIVGARKKHKVPVFVDNTMVMPFATASGGGLVASGRF
jgi:tetratricopeptide (TPR) repeat protein